LFQIPAGIISMRLGMKRTVILGTATSLSATFLSAIVSSSFLLILLRLVAGSGIALLFTPGVSLIASYYPMGSEGFGVSVYDGSSCVGGIFAYVADVIIASALGWRAALTINALVGVLVGIAFFAILPNERKRIGFEIRLSKIRDVLLDSWLLTIGLSLLGLEFTSALVGNFMVFYLSSGLKETALFSGLVGSVLPAAGLASTAFIGKVFDRTQRPKVLILLLGILSALGLAVSALETLGGSLLSTSMVGFFGSAGFIVCIAASRKISGKHHDESEYEVLGISWVITLSLVGSFVAPIFFSFATVSLGYPVAWISSALISLVFFLPLVLSMFKGRGTSIETTESVQK
jgi:MFS family permease